eukprot:TRINITY_DN3007_c0_g1_i3.p1 TRINITY_DN3007_c0_g1~~TRINITY_DN3007_c0_g1_i3.p1  ORF type:complete len:2699 (-),score=548.83 TRINITY_DN3007_c0_g1_i3:24-7613(-)
MSVKDIFGEFVDVMIGWRLDTRIDTQAAEAIHAFIDASRDLWQSLPDVTDALLGQLAGDLLAVQESSVEGPVFMSQAFMQLFVHVACAAQTTQRPQQHISSFVSALVLTAERMSGSAAVSSTIVATVQRLLIDFLDQVATSSSADRLVMLVAPLIPTAQLYILAPLIAAIKHKLTVDCGTAIRKATNSCLAKDPLSVLDIYVQLARCSSKVSKAAVKSMCAVVVQRHSNTDTSQIAQRYLQALMQIAAGVPATQRVIGIHLAKLQSTATLRSAFQLQLVELMTKHLPLEWATTGKGFLAKYATHSNPAVCVLVMRWAIQLFNSQQPADCVQSCCNMALHCMSMSACRLTAVELLQTATLQTRWRDTVLQQRVADVLQKFIGVGDVQLSAMCARVLVSCFPSHPKIQHDHTSYALAQPQLFGCFLEALRGSAPAVRMIQRAYQLIQPLAESQLEALQWAAHAVPIDLVSKRLRTVLGDPVQTLAAIEKLVTEVVGRASELTRVSIVCTLSFLFSLETAFRDAYSTPSSFDSKVTSFFRSNRKVCDDWLTRIRPAAAQLSSTSGALQDVTYHCSQMLSTRKPRETVFMVQALASLCEHDALVGLRMWAAEGVDPSINELINAACSEAAGRYEEAIGLYAALAHRTTGQAQVVCIDRMAVCAACLPVDWTVFVDQKFSEWTLQQQHTDVLKALHAFDTQDVEGASLLGNTVTNFHLQPATTIATVAMLHVKDSHLRTELDDTLARVGHDFICSTMLSCSVSQQVQAVTALCLAREVLPRLLPSGSPLVASGAFRLRTDLDVDNLVRIAKSMRKSGNLKAAEAVLSVCPKQKSSLVFAKAKVLGVLQPSEALSLLQRSGSVFDARESQKLALLQMELKQQDSEDVGNTLASLCADASVPVTAKALFQYGNWSFAAGFGGQSDEEAVLHVLQSQTAQLLIQQAHADSTDLTSVTSQLVTACCDESEFTGEMSQLVRQLKELITVRITEHRANAASAFFRYLRSRNTSYDANVVVTVVKLLWLLVHSRPSQQADWAQQIVDCDPDCWSQVIPQLFARMTHPRAHVRDLVQSLLLRIATRVPQSIIIPTIVGGVDTFGQYAQLREALQQLYPRKYGAVRVFVTELVRVSLLPEERWAVVIARLMSGMANRIRTLRHDVKRLRANAAMSDEEKTKLAAERFVAVMRPVVVDIERACRADAAPATPHETSFVAKFSDRLEQAIAALKSPMDALHPDNSWTVCDEVLQDILRLSKHATLQMERVSPTLCATQWRGTVEMPSQTISSVHPTCIAKVSSEITVIQSKTKPKKIAFVGEDGETYSYLLKGREDLHLDERIMQLLSIINQFLVASPRACARQLQSRHYAVIPLSSQAGLIQWVNDAHPLFSVYKSYLSSTVAPGTTAPRAVDMFFAKIIPLLKARGISSSAPRRDWPKDVLKAVVQQLAEETPIDLLSREFCKTSQNAGAWWETTKMFGRSTAVMSMIGYVIGLGDRHLDNILVNFQSGSVVHIDYNVCFEKGTRLKVPETVPFRLTRVMRNAYQRPLGDGVFHTASCITLATLRDSQSTLMTLLEAFAYDPLVDWTTQRAEDEERRGAEACADLFLFASRVEEEAVELLARQGALTQSVEHVLRAFNDTLPALQQRQKRHQDHLAAETMLHAAKQTADTLQQRLDQMQQSHEEASSKANLSGQSYYVARDEALLLREFVTGLVQCTDKARDALLTEWQQYEEVLPSLPQISTVPARQKELAVVQQQLSDAYGPCVNAAKAMMARLSVYVASSNPKHDPLMAMANWLTLALSGDLVTSEHVQSAVNDLIPQIQAQAQAQRTEYLASLNDAVGTVIRTMIDQQQESEAEGLSFKEQLVQAAKGVTRLARDQSTCLAVSKSLFGLLSRIQSRVTEIVNLPCARYIPMQRVAAGILHLRKLYCDHVFPIPPPVARAFDLVPLFADIVTTGCERFVTNFSRVELSAMFQQLVNDGSVVFAAAGVMLQMAQGLLRHTDADFAVAAAKEEFLNLTSGHEPSNAANVLLAGFASIFLPFEQQCLSLLPRIVGVTMKQPMSSEASMSKAMFQHKVLLMASVLHECCVASADVQFLPIVAACGRHLDLYLDFMMADVVGPLAELCLEALATSSTTLRGAGHDAAMKGLPSVEADLQARDTLHRASTRLAVLKTSQSALEISSKQIQAYLSALQSEKEADYQVGVAVHDLQLLSSQANEFRELVSNCIAAHHSYVVLEDAIQGDTQKKQFNFVKRTVLARRQHTSNAIAKLSALTFVIECLQIAASVRLGSTPYLRLIAKFQQTMLTLIDCHRTYALDLEQVALRKAELDALATEVETANAKVSHLQQSRGLVAATPASKSRQHLPDLARSALAVLREKPLLRQLVTYLHGAKRAARRWLPALDVVKTADALFAGLESVSTRLETCLAAIASEDHSANLQSLQEELTACLTTVATCATETIALGKLCASLTASSEDVDDDAVEAIPETAQERNKYAEDALSTINKKLRGDGFSDIKQQVDALVSQSVSLSHLSVMFEGWMPWV